MPLSARFQQQFLDVDRSRGDAYFHEDRVRIVDERGDYAASLVRGSGGESYFAQLEFGQVESNLASASCECGRYQTGFFCKHLWATIRALEQHPELAHLPGHGGIQLQRWRDVDEPVPARQEIPHAWQPRSDVPALHAPTGNSNAVAPRSSWWKRLEPLWRDVCHQRDYRLGPMGPHDDGKRYWLVISAADQSPRMPLHLQLYYSQRRKDGTWSSPRPTAMRTRPPYDPAPPTEACAGLSGLRPYRELLSNSSSAGIHSDFYIDAGLLDTTLQELCERQMLIWTLVAERSLSDYQPVTWDDRFWEIKLRLDRRSTQESAEGDAPIIEVSCQLLLGEERLEVADVVAMARPGLFLTRDRLSRVADSDLPWLEHFRRDPSLCLRADELDAFLKQLAGFPRLPQLEFDAGLPVDVQVAEPQGVIQVGSEGCFARAGRMEVTAYFRYGSREVHGNHTAMAHYEPDPPCLQLRNRQREDQLLQFLGQLPLLRSEFPTGKLHYTLQWRDFSQVVRACADSGWEVVAHGRRLRTPGNLKMAVRAHTDWFDLEASVHFGDQAVELPVLLTALRQKQEYILLDDGSQGILPEAWLARYADLCELGQESGQGVRFCKSQAVLLDMLLAEQEDVTRDASFAQLIDKIRDFRGIAPAHKPRGFRGTLRGYQQEGLGWLNFLRDFELGGCLADDMGLGKTIQVLALLQARRLAAGRLAAGATPSLVVVPKSLVFNWLDEARRFTPRLRMLDYTGLKRADTREQFSQCDVVVTTYGTVRRDMEYLVKQFFDYVILDEAQAIKNAGSQVSKACRLLRARHRLAMTGTPVENHLGELWALFDFLNPGMLGKARHFRRLTSRAADGEPLAWLAHALRPFILRRTKAQVLQELPPKQEQTLYCEMTPAQSRLYQELRDYYRQQVRQKIDQLGMQRSKIHVLEALLRLRQAACDPRLLGRRDAPPGVKIATLVEQLREIVDEGHKALVFSQFTSLLALVRQEVDRQAWDYEYLDGKTRDRGRRVQRFQEDPCCALFLISLKAGGHGLNLTAADYVFILDPWWNPAVEAQAVDRAHRLGQTRSVMAYRLICKDTVEEKILQLQGTKKELADAIVMADKSLISELSLDDLQLLFHG